MSFLYLLEYRTFSGTMPVHLSHVLHFDDDEFRTMVFDGYEFFLRAHVDVQGEGDWPELSVKGLFDDVVKYLCSERKFRIAELTSQVSFGGSPVAFLHNDTSGDTQDNIRLRAHLLSRGVISKKVE